MVEAGFDTVFIGIETPDEDSLVECSKKQNGPRPGGDVRRIQRAACRCRVASSSASIATSPSIFRADRFHPEERHRHGDGRAPAGAPRHQAVRTPEGRGAAPGSDVRRQCGWDDQHRPQDGPGTLKAGYRYILEHIYSPEYYYERVRTFLREYKPPKDQGAAGLPVHAGLLPLHLPLGIKGEERRYNTGSCSSGRCSGAQRCSRWPSPSRSTDIHFRKVCEAARAVARPGRYPARPLPSKADPGSGPPSLVACRARPLRLAGVG
jgi:hypothetical protein